MFAPGTNGRGAIDDTADDFMGNQIGFQFLRDVLGIWNDHKCRMPVCVIDANPDLYPLQGQRMKGV